MFGFIFTNSPYKEDIWNKMGVANNWVYQKNNESIFVPKKEILAGLHVGTKLIYSNDPIPEEYHFKSWDTISRLYKNNQLVFNTPIFYKGEVTTYGILKLTELLRKELRDILQVKRNEDIDINSTTMAKISAYIKTLPDRVNIVSELMNLGDAWIKQYGSSLIRLSELYKVDADFPEIEKILNSDRSEKEKMIRLDKMLSDIIKSKIKEKMPSLAEEMGVQGVKQASVVAMVQPFITETSTGFKISNRNLITGYGEEEFVHHAATTREILKQKAALVPIGGYLNRCMTNAMSNFTLKTDEQSTDTIGILVRKYDAIGRYDLYGKEIGSTSKDDKTMVRIKSCIYSKGDRRYHIAIDELNHKLYSIKKNSAIGIQCSTTTTEGITQEQLALKHGGRLFSPSLECVQIHEPLSVVEISDKYIVLGKGADRIIYPLPENVVFTKETLTNSLRSEDIVFYIDDIQYVDYNIKRIGSVVGFISPSEKNNPSATKYQSSKCISPVTGKIHYDFKKNKVTIGTMSFGLNRDVVYYYPEGATVEQYHKFCSGTLSPRDILSMTNDIEVQFGLFYAQIKELLPKLQLLSIELLFKTLFIIGDGLLLSAISKDPFQIMKNQKAVKVLSAILGKEIEVTLQGDIMLGLHMRDYI